MKKYKAVIFDLDGTLVDSMGVWEKVDAEFLESRGISVPKNLFQDLEGGNSFNEVAKYFKDRFNLKESIEEILAFWTDMVKHHYQDNIQLKPGADKLLEYLKNQEIIMGVGSSNSLFLVKATLKNNNVYHYFDAFATGEEKVKGKPFPDIFLNVAKRLDVKPEECIVIEDILDGVKAAKNAGMKVFAIYDKHADKQKNEIKNEADFYADNYSILQEKFSQILS